MVCGVTEHLIKVICKRGVMETMSMVLVVRYNEEKLCSPESMKSWFENKECVVDDTKITTPSVSFDWSHMKMVNTLMFVVDVNEDEDFPAVLFDYIMDLEGDDTIISLAEEGMGSFHLIFEANRPRFVKELVEGE